jgi:hypothetical protein
MNDSEIRNKILKILSDAYKQRYKKGIIKTEDIRSMIGCDNLAVKRNIEYLIGKKLVQHARNGKMITELGLDIANPEAAIKPVAENKNQSIQITGSSVGNIAQAHNITINPVDFLEQMAGLIEQTQSLNLKQRKSLACSVRDLPKHPLFVLGFQELFRGLKFW